MTESEIKKKVGMLRQWLNEDRITDPKKMVTDEDILYFLGMATSEEVKESHSYEEAMNKMFKEPLDKLDNLKIR